MSDLFFTAMGIIVSKIPPLRNLRLMIDMEWRTSKTMPEFKAESQFMTNPFALRFTNHSSDSPFRTRECFMEVSSKGWKLAFPILEVQSNNAINVNVPIVDDSGWLDVYCRIPITGQTMLGVLHSNRTRVRLVVKRIGGLRRVVHYEVPPSEWWGGVLFLPEERPVAISQTTPILEKIIEKGRNTWLRIRQLVKK